MVLFPYGFTVVYFELLLTNPFSLLLFKKLVSENLLLWWFSLNPVLYNWNELSFYVDFFGDNVQLILFVVLFLCDYKEGG